MKFKTSHFLLLALLLVGTTTTINADLIGDIGLGALCGGAVVGLEAQSCADELSSRMQPYTTSDGEVPVFVVCCQLNIFETCVTDKIKSVCGDDTGNAAKKLLKLGISGVTKYVRASDNGELDCVGHWWYEPESPLCWPYQGQIAGGIALVLILLISCCCCCRCCFRRRNRKRTAGISFVSMVPTSLPQFQPAPRGQVAYAQLTNDSV